MKVAEVLPYFENRVSRMARELDVTTQAVYYWKTHGIPKKQELLLKYEILPKLKTK